MERLRAYRAKRNFDRTSEPAGEARKGAAGARRFVVHKHAARRLHYDLRLEQDGVLRSWALPKGPSLAEGEKRLAVEVEDHPLDYADFEGTIPAGEYGAGTVMLWDRGHWTPVGEGERAGRLDFALEGTKLRGTWTLTRMGGKGGEHDKHWLMIKRSDADREPLEPDETSVLSGRTMAAIEQQAGQPEVGAAAERSADAPAMPAGARRRALAREPWVQLATLVGRVPEGDAWIHEIKFDGYRIVAHVEEGAVRLFTRNRHDWTERFPEIAAALARLGVRRALIDGEVVAVGADGISSFGGLQAALRRGARERLRYQAFDLMHLDDYDLRDVAQLDRKALLATLLAGAEAAGPIVRYTDHVTGHGPDVLARACEMGLEGVISKRGDAAYREGRGRRWLKAKCTRREPFVVGGFTPPRGSRSGFGALLLGAFRDDALTYVGRVGSGFSERALGRLHERLQALERPDSPFAGSVPDAREATWVEPVLVVEVAFTERTDDGRLRHPTFAGLLTDTDPATVSAPADACGPPPRPRRPARRRKDADDAEVAGVRLSNATRVLYPEQGITKLDLARYYASIAGHALGAMAGRPLALVRCPQGREQACFYQKHPGEAFPRDLPRVAIEGSSGTREYAHVRNVADLVGLVQVGVLEIHVWGCRIDAVERPDLMVIDLDPGPEVPWSTTCATALALRDRLHALDLAAFVRTTGGKGLHVVVPLTRRHGWDEVKAFARALCARHAAGQDHLVTTASKAKRHGRIYLDSLRNGRGATAIASFSTRARPKAPVAVPVRWDELDAKLRSDRYRVYNLRRRLAALPTDPWAGFAAEARTITVAMRKAVGL